MGCQWRVRCLIPFSFSTSAWERRKLPKPCAPWARRSRCCSITSNPDAPTKSGCLPLPERSAWRIRVNPPNGWCSPRTSGFDAGLRRRRLCWVSAVPERLFEFVSASGSFQFARRSARARALGPDLPRGAEDSSEGRGARRGRALAGARLGPGGAAVARLRGWAGPSRSAGRRTSSARDLGNEGARGLVPGRSS